MTDKTQHIPVLLGEILQMISGMAHTPRRGLDLTFGRGGHTRVFLEQWPELKMEAWDRDPEAIEFGTKYFGSFIQDGRLALNHRNFHDVSAPIFPGYDFILMDLGVSSPQLDSASRGFSFYHQGPLDMRMDPTRGETAADVVNQWSESELIELFQSLGEIRRPHRVVKAIVTDRRKKPYSLTQELSQLIERVEGWQRKGHHPATRYFLALRMQVNAELDGLEPVIPHLIQSLVSGGRLMIITFHSLEDRIIKYALREQLEYGQLVNKKVIVPSRDECLRNPRSRSAKLRVFQRG